MPDIRILPLALALTLAGIDAQSAEVYGIGKVPNAKLFESVQDFEQKIGCLKGGDRLVLEPGRRHQGPLALRVCDDAGSGVIAVVSGGSNGASSVLDGSTSAATLGLSWKAADSGKLPKAASGEHQIFSLGPLPGPVTQVVAGDRVLRIGSWPEQDGKTPVRTVSLSEVRTQAEGCKNWMCVGSKDPRWAQLVKEIGSLAPELRPDLVLRNSPWSYTRHPIAGVDEGRGILRLESSGGNTSAPEDRDFAEPGFGALLVDAPSLLNEPDEWWFDKQERMLHIVSRKGTTSSSLQETVRLSIGRSKAGAPPDTDAALSIVASGKGSASNITFKVRGIELAMAAASGLRVRGLSGLEVDDVKINHSVEHGMDVSDVDRVRIRSSQVSGTGNNGMLFVGVEDLEVLDNSINGSGTIGEQRQLTMHFSGIRAAGFTRAVIQRNQIDSVGYAAIMLGEKSAFMAKGQVEPELTIGSNRISRFCRMLNDCGAIYINGGLRGKKPEPGAGSRISKRVVNNQISEPQPLLAGLPGEGVIPKPADAKGGAWVRMVGAVYLDHGASGYDIRGNEVSGSYTPYGWKVFNGGIENACSRPAAEKCMAGPKAYRCYTDALGDCNTIREKR